MFFQAFKNELAELPEALAENIQYIPELLQECKSANTVTCYYRGFMRWKKWAVLKGLSESDCLPAKAIHVALYLAGLVQESHTVNPIVQAYYSIKWAHSLFGVESPTDSVIVRNILEGAKRRFSVSKDKKEPITPVLLEKMFDGLSDRSNFYNQRTICACLLSFAGFLRVSELLNLRICDVDVFDSYLSIFIEKSKTDIYRDGNYVMISRTYNKLCPVRNFEVYLSFFPKPIDSDLYLFQNLCKTNNGFVFRSINKPLSYTRMRELFIEAFSPYVKDICKYGLHSLRSGGATSAANAGVPDRLFKRHGRWRSENAKDGYVKDSIENMLSVSRNLGI